MITKNDFTIILSDEINKDTSATVIAYLLELQNKDDSRDITLLINSSGGDVFSGFAIIDIMNWIRNDVVTIVNGCACSMASLIASAGTKGKRLITKHSKIMIHSASSSVAGKEVDIESTYNNIKDLNNQVIDFYANVTNKSKDIIKEDLKKDTWLDAEMSVEYNLVDDII